MKSLKHPGRTLPVNIMKNRYVTRQTVVTALLLITTMTTQTQANDDRPDPTVGAIRWDAWTGGTVTAQVEKTLSPKRYQHRLPWFAEVIDDQTARIDGSPQSVMDREIEFAANAGLDYWAFLIYQIGRAHV